jgi:hypothetical protein
VKHRETTLKDRVFALLDQGLSQQKIIARILREYPESKFKNAPVERIYFYRCRWKQARAKRAPKRAA